MKKSIYTIITSIALYAAIGNASITHAETIFVKYRGMVDLSEFSCTDTESSFVHRICYKDADQYLIVLLGDTYYHYCEIPRDVVQQWLSTESKGGVYNSNIKGNFDCRLNGYVVTPSINGLGGTMNPPDPVSAYSGDRVSFTVMPNLGYVIDSVGGTCGGKLSGNIYKTNEISHDCTVVAKFRQ